MSLRLELPTIQNWSCHSCGGCCRVHAIGVTEAERERILKQNWTEAEGAPAGDAAFKRVGSGGYQLAHRADGACVFLDANNRCRIHAKFGEAAKPLACRVYPYQFHPAGDGTVAVSLRFSCPTVAHNGGTPLVEQRRDLEQLRDLVVPAGAGRDEPAPALSKTQTLDWADTARVVRRFREMLADEGDDDEETKPMALRIAHALFVAGMLNKAKFDKIRGERVDELLDVLATCAPAETVQSADDVPPPSGPGRAQFRTALALYARLDSAADTSMGYRLRMMMAGMKLAMGRGETPSMQGALTPVPFASLEKPFSGRSEEIDDLFARYFDVKLAGWAFCGQAGQGRSVIDGFYNLILIYPVALYLARWLATAAGRDTLTLADAERALSIADHHFGYSGAMALPNFRNRVAWLAEHEQLAPLAAWYSQ